MKYRQLGKTNIKVSEICLGTMTYGVQNTEQQAHQQLDYALSQGINFIDTAEIYAVPPSEQTFGITERYIGTWLQHQNRENIILASKVSGPGDDWLPYIRNGNNRLDKKNIETAVNDSLIRLKTDYIDLYQVHWPERKANFFGNLGYHYECDDNAISLQETFSALVDLVKAGKIRAIGVSNETPWGLMQYLELSKIYNAVTIACIQNPYNLLNRSFEIGLAEISVRETCGLLSYSPLGFGRLSGKYITDPKIKNSRLNLFPDYTRYNSDNALAATQAYVDIACKYDLQAAQMALAYINSRTFVTSNIIGATTMAQLEENISSSELHLSDEIIAEIEIVHERYPNPSP